MEEASGGKPLEHMVRVVSVPLSDGVSLSFVTHIHNLGVWLHSLLLLLDQISAVARTVLLHLLLARVFALFLHSKAMRDHSSDLLPNAGHRISPSNSCLKPMTSGCAAAYLGERHPSGGKESK